MTAPKKSIRANPADKLREQVRRLRDEIETLKEERRSAREAQGILEESLDRYADLYDFAPVGYITLHPSGLMRDPNLTAADMLGRERIDVEGRPLLRLVALEDRKKFLNHMERCRAAKAGASVVTELKLVPPGLPARIVQVISVSPRDDWGRRFWRTALLDVTAQRQAEDALRRGKELSDALNRINESLHATLESGQITQRLVEVGAAALGSETAAVSLRRNGGWIVSHVKNMAVEAVGTRSTDDQERHAVLAVNSGRPVAVSDAWEDERVNTGHMRKNNVRAVLVAPLIGREGPLGAIFFNYHSAPHSFTAAEVDFAGQLGATAAIALDNARLLDERQHAVDALSHAAAALERSNQDLQQFAYIAGHDLQEPLRAIDGFLGLLRHRCGDRLDAKSLEYIQYAVEGAGRMSQFIRDLLEYSRVQTGAQEIVETDMNAVFDRAAVACMTSIRQAGAKVTREELPTVRGDSSRLSQLLASLIDNAVKFRRPQEAPEVRMGSRRDGAEWVFWVQDNGIGIAPNQAERVFQVFQRLHTREQYPGTGIGLAICKKIVERHGGRIWVESHKGAGAKFLFTLPAE